MGFADSDQTPIIENLVVGGGPCGLGAAWRLQELGRPWLLLERDDEVGGLARSFVDASGFTWDIGGHVLFSHYGYFDDLMRRLFDESQWLTHQRECWVRLRDRWVPYPFQYNLRHLPPEDQMRCLLGLLEVARQGSPRPPENFHQWIVATFGPGLADIFMLPYNFKVWAYPPEQLACGWVGERVAVTDLAQVLRNLVYQRDEASWGPNNVFRFPARGATGAIWRACADRLPQDRLHRNCGVTAIDLDRREATTSAGRKFRFERLISTMPLVELCRLARRDDWQRQALRLKHSATHVVGLGIRGKVPAELATKCWIYFPEDNSPFYRVTVFSNYSPHNTPPAQGLWSLLAEVSESPCKPVRRDTVVEEVVSGLLQTGLLDAPDRIVSRWQHRVEYGYPTPCRNREAILPELLEGFQKRGVYSRGRFGAWKYEVGNMDHSFMQGVEVAEYLCTGRPEATLYSPSSVNAGSMKDWPTVVPQTKGVS